MPPGTIQIIQFLIAVLTALLVLFRSLPGG